MTLLNMTVALQSAFMIEHNRFVLPINGIISPLFILITLITNVIICAVLLAPNMRSPTNIILVAIATSDAVTVSRYLDNN